MDPMVFQFITFVKQCLKIIVNEIPGVAGDG